MSEDEKHYAKVKIEMISQPKLKISDELNKKIEQSRIAFNEHLATYVYGQPDENCWRSTPLVAQTLETIASQMNSANQPQQPEPKLFEKSVDSATYYMFGVWIDRSKLRKFDNYIFANTAYIAIRGAYDYHHRAGGEQLAKEYLGDLWCECFGEAAPWLPDSTVNIKPQPEDYAPDVADIMHDGRPNKVARVITLLSPDFEQSDTANKFVVKQVEAEYRLYRQKGGLEKFITTALELLND